MGLFDKFRKKVREAASEADTDSLSAEEGSEEAIQAINQQQELTQNPEQQIDESPQFDESEEEDWEEFDDD